VVPAMTVHTKSQQVRQLVLALVTLIDQVVGMYVFPATVTAAPMIACKAGYCHCWVEARQACTLPRC
jgi:hypothetical protein